LAERTREIYESQLRLHILPVIDDELPALGMVKLVDLTPALVRAWYQKLQSQRSPSVAAKAYTRLRQILTQAVNDDRILKNPCRIERGGVENHPEQRFASLEELYALAGAVPARYRALVLMAGLAGLRQGELAALRRGDIDLIGQSVSVVRKRLSLELGVVIEDAPKTEVGRRTVSIPIPLVRELKMHFESFVDSEPDSYVLTSPDGLPIERSNLRYRVWVPATERVGVAGLRFHDLRHTAGTLAAQTGATTKELMARLGHASHQAAMVYQHAAPIVIVRSPTALSGWSQLRASASEGCETGRATRCRSDGYRNVALLSIPPRHNGIPCQQALPRCAADYCTNIHLSSNGRGVT
jgi:integrase